MRILNQDEIEKLHYHINDKGISFIEVRDEVLDHYQTALENENHRSMEEVLKSLDQIFTPSYCKNIAKQYQKDLKNEYPDLLKEKLKQYFSWRRLPLTVLILSLGACLPMILKNESGIIHLVNAVNLLFLSIESFLIQRGYPRKNVKHHYRLIDKKPVLARIQSKSLKGWGSLNLIVIILILPLLVFHLNNFFSTDDGYRYVFPYPLLHIICFMTSFLVFIHFINLEISKNRFNPKIL
jgi:hypothetical protein